jgi:radical SAM superfamily enzyme YgiQ (UPF0313 family)
MTARTVRADMRVTIVAANQEHRPDPVVPLGALYVAGAARAAGHDVSLVDLCFAGDDFAPALAARLAETRPDVVGVSLRNVDDVAWPRARSYLPHYRRVVETIRAAAPDAALVLGGAAFTLFPEPYLAELAPDVGVAGEGEAAFVSVLADLEAGRAPPRLVRVPAGEGDLGVAPAIDLVDAGRYFRTGGAVNVQTRRGCVFHCSYCTYPELEGSTPRLRPPAEVVDTIARAVAGGTDYVFFVDNVFNAPIAHALAICDEILRRGLKVRWTAFVTPASLTGRLVEKMVAAGCTSVDMGTDAGSPATLAALGKPFGPARIREAARLCREAGLRFGHSLILGGPNETWATLAETEALVEETDPTAVVGMLGVRLYRDTPLGRLAVREGWVKAGEIGLEPLFYVSPAVREGLADWAKGVAQARPRWFFPGLVGDRLDRWFEAMRRRGARGPLWELLGAGSLSRAASGST